MAVVEYDTAMEALNAVSMFNQQVLNDRQMNVRFDAKPPSSEEEKPKNLPSGLKSIGKGISLPTLGTDSLLKSQTGPDLSMLSSLGININGTAPGLMSKYTIHLKLGGIN